MGINLKFIKKRPWLAWILFACTVTAVFLMGLLAASITERRMEAAFVNVPKTEIRPFEPRNEIWGQNYPREFQSY
ncbi:MAG: ammonia-forming cytochrome c nitrite reductase subunit c552, partial [Prolixibacteraceae bacterium]|nr:ammonia-forming cytochrome c nitrite reductase subunit c552 [Prolixibacteraceae bacterium]